MQCKTFRFQYFFVVTNITGTRNLEFTVELTLVTINNNVIKDIVSNFTLKVGLSFINTTVTTKRSPKFSTLVTDLICQARLRMSTQLSTNEYWYRQLCRKFYLGSQLRSNIVSNIKKMARSATFNLGGVKMSVDPFLFNLNDKNKYRVTFELGNLHELDEIMGCKWDIRPHVEGVNNSFFYFVNKVIIYVDKDDQLKVKFTYAGSTFPVCENYRAKIAVTCCSDRSVWLCCKLFYRVALIPQLVQFYDHDFVTFFV